MASKPLIEPKKVKSRATRRASRCAGKLLAKAGLPRAHWSSSRTAEGAADDDVIDALACAALARRLHHGTARPFPDPPPRDAYGLPMAIWA